MPDEVEKSDSRVETCPVTLVRDDESLYRSIPDTQECHSIRDGQLYLSSSAFNDRGQRPSVDRCCMQISGPDASRVTPECGVVTLAAAEVRTIAIQGFDQNKNPTSRHAVDVQHVPLPENAAHAEVYANPDVATSAFKRLKERLCAIALKNGWAALPGSLRKQA